MTFADAAQQYQRRILAAMLAGSAVVLLPAAVEPFMLPKITVIVLLALALGGLSVARAVEVRSVGLPVSPAAWAALAFGAAAVVTTVTSGEPWASVIGFYGRYTGLVPYLCYLLVFLVLLRVCNLGLVRLLTRTALVALGATVLYGVVQAAGAEPFGFIDKGLGTTFAFFGNVNFSAAWAGAVVGLALMTAFDRREHRGWRVYGAALVPLALLFIAINGTAQGPIVALVSLTWAGLLIATQEGRLRDGLRERRRLVLMVAGGLAVVLAVLVGAALPVLRDQLDQSLVERPDFWSAALRIFADHPVVGTGLDTYAHHFLAYRPAGHALANGIATTDAPHSVPLGMLANGGLLLGLAHLALVVTVGVALVRGALRAPGPERLALAGWGGVWLGYQVQSLVSFDVPPLAMLHWVSAGVIVALAAPPRWREVRLPGRPPARPVNRKGKAYGAATVPSSTRSVQAGVLVLALAAAWFALYPLRADLTAASAEPLTSSGRIDEAIERFESATKRNPAEASYPFLAARGHEALGQPAPAYAEAVEAARRDPGTVQYALFAARQARAVGDLETARTWYADAVERDPKDPPVLNEAASFLVSVGDAPGAVQLFERSLALDPANADARSGLDGLQGAS